MFTTLLPRTVISLIIVIKLKLMALKRWTFIPHWPGWSTEKTSLHSVVVKASNRMQLFIIFLAWTST